MKNYILAGMLAVMAIPAAGQFQVGSAYAPTAGRAGSLKDEDLAQLKASTTIFVVMEDDTARLDDFRRSLADVWTVTPYRVVKADSARFFRGRKYSLFGIGSFTVTPMKSDGMSGGSTTFATFDLTIPEFNRHGEPKESRTLLGRFMMSGTGYGETMTMAEFQREKRTIQPIQSGEHNRLIFTDRSFSKASYNNWGPGQIRGFVKAINDHLLIKDRHGMFDDITEREELRALSKDTLYLPDYLQNGYGGWFRNQKRVEEDLEENTQESYPFPYRYINEEDLEKMLIHPSKPTYHLVYVRGAPHKFVVVVEAQSGKIIYSRHMNVSFNFKMRDLKLLSKQMD